MPRAEWPVPWAGSVAIANIGLNGVAIMSTKWEQHRSRLLRQFKGMMNYRNVCGLCLCEVGSIDHPH